MDKLTHWTQQSTKDFVYSISSNFVAQIEMKIEEEGIRQSEIADKMNKTSGRISQVLNNPGNLSIRSMVELARAAGMKVSIVAYDDRDPDNTRGPIDPDVFRRCWENADCPQNLFDVDRAFAAPSAVSILDLKHSYFGSIVQQGPIGGAAVIDFSSFDKKSGTSRNGKVAAA